MPAYEAMFVQLLLALEHEETVILLQDLLQQEKPLVEIIDELNLVQGPGQLEFIAQTPESIQAAILAVVRQNLSRGAPKQMMFNWTPSYDWELRLWESTSSSISAGGITVQVGSRYPDDPHPGQTLA